MKSSAGADDQLDVQIQSAPTALDERCIDRLLKAKRAAAKRTVSLESCHLPQGTSATHARRRSRVATPGAVADAASGLVPCHLPRCHAGEVEDGLGSPALGGVDQTLAGRLAGL